MTEREKLIKLLSTTIYPREGADPAEVVADFLLDHGVALPVRCEECKFYDFKHPNYRQPWGVCLMTYQAKDNDDFCKYGERREDNGT